MRKLTALHKLLLLDQLADVSLSAVFVGLAIELDELSDTGLSAPGVARLLVLGSVEVSNFSRDWNHRSVLLYFFFQIDFEIINPGFFSLLVNCWQIRDWVDAIGTVGE